MKVNIFHAGFIFGLILNTFILSVTGQDSLIITEFMAINNDNLEDEDGDNVDWIEIYNADTSAINLAGWYLTDDSLDYDKWVFPSVSIDSAEYLIIYASGKDRKLEKGKLHTNFKLSGSGEFLALIKPGGNEIASVFTPAYPEQAADVSYGLLEDGYTYLSIPTPGTENESQKHILPPKFSVQHGYFYEPFNLELFGNVNIYYTTDASTPSDTNGTKYTEPIGITSSSVIRAIAIQEGVGESATKTQTYIFPEEVIHQSDTQPGYPLNWPSPIHGTDEYFEIDANYGTDKEITQLPVVKSLFTEALNSLPVVSVVTDIPHLFSWSMHPDSGGIYMYNGEPDGSTSSLMYHLGRGWERAASVEYFNPGSEDDELDFQTNCALKIHGGATRTRRKNLKHSFKLGFKSKYGPNKLYEQVFDEDSPEQYDWLVLRGGFHSRYGQQIRDPWGKSTFRDMGHYAGRSKFVHVFLNGMYWGMYNLAEQMDENCMRDNLGGDDEDYDVLKDYFEVEAGDTIAWSKLVSMIGYGDPEGENYQKILGNNPDGTPNPAYEKLIDPDNLIDYILFNFQAGNTDWDHHNWVAARRKTDSEGFQFFPWDLEYTLLSVSENRTSGGVNYNRPTGIFADLLMYAPFQNLVVQHINKHFFESGALTPDPCLNRYNTWLDVIDTTLVSDQGRWGGLENDIFNTNLHQFRFDYFEKRTEIVFKQLVENELYPYVAPPQFNTNLYKLPEDFDLTLTSPDGGEILYTIDGTDPGHYYMAEKPSIMVYDNNPFTLTDTLIVYARVKKDTLWSTLVKRQFVLENEPGTPIDHHLSEKDGYMHCYPNPLDRFANLELYLPKESHINIQIYNLLGEMVISHDAGLRQSGEHTIIIDTDDMGPGIYYCIATVNNNTQQYQIKLIKK